MTRSVTGELDGQPIYKELRKFTVPTILYVRIRRAQQRVVSDKKYSTIKMDPGDLVLRTGYATIHMNSGKTILLGFTFLVERIEKLEMWGLP